MNEKKYVFLDWSVSGINFLIVQVIYRYSSGMDSLGEAGWLLNLLTTSLFVSAAAQYLMMFRSRGIWETYFSFMPVLAVEIAFLSTQVPLDLWVLLSVSLIANLLFACYRGSLMSAGKLFTAAKWNLTEQVCRFCFLYGLILGGTIPGNALFLSTASAYIIMGSVVTVLLFSSGIRPGFSMTGINYELFRDTFWFSFIHAGIYLATNVDVLALKHFPERNQFVLLKPWGQILFTALFPLVNVYLTKLKYNKKRESRITIFYIIGFSSVYSAVMLLFGRSINWFLFHKELSSTGLLLAVILEHFFLIFMVIKLYNILLMKGSRWHAAVLTASVIIPILLIPCLARGVAVYAGYVSWYIILFVANYIILASPEGGGKNIPDPIPRKILREQE
ncbi:MAG: hypothetical protein ACOY31_04555 [Bacillota bacterium]